MKEMAVTSSQEKHHKDGLCQIKLKTSSGIVTLKYSRSESKRGRTSSRLVGACSDLSENKFQDRISLERDAYSADDSIFESLPDLNESQDVILSMAKKVTKCVFRTAPPDFSTYQFWTADSVHHSDRINFSWEEPSGCQDLDNQIHGSPATPPHEKYANELKVNLSGETTPLNPSPTSRPAGLQIGYSFWRNSLSDTETVILTEQSTKGACTSTDKFSDSEKCLSDWSNQTKFQSCSALMDMEPVLIYLPERHCEEGYIVTSLQSQDAAPEMASPAAESKMQKRRRTRTFQTFSGKNRRSITSRNSSSLVPSYASGFYNNDNSNVHKVEESSSTPAIFLGDGHAIFNHKLFEEAAVGFARAEKSPTLSSNMSSLDDLFLSKTSSMWSPMDTYDTCNSKANRDQVDQRDPLKQKQINISHCGLSPLCNDEETKGVAKNLQIHQACSQIAKTSKFRSRQYFKGGIRKEVRESPRRRNELMHIEECTASSKVAFRFAAESLKRQIMPTSKTRKRKYRKVKREPLPSNAVEILQEWINDHMPWPYPTRDEKQELVSASGLRLTQIENWMANSRQKLKQELGPRDWRITRAAR